MGENGYLQFHSSTANLIVVALRLLRCAGEIRRVLTFCGLREDTITSDIEEDIPALDSSSDSESVFDIFISSFLRFSNVMLDIVLLS